MFTAILLPIEEYESFLLLIGSLFIPLFGVSVTDYFIVKKREYKIDELYRHSGIYWYRGGFNIKAVAAWMIGVLCYHYVITYMSWLGASIPSFAVAAVIYWLSMLVGS